MAKKRAIKGITKINQKQAALEGYSYERAYHTAKQAGEPSYRFAVGDKVQVGHLLNCVVDEILEGGYMVVSSSSSCPLFAQTTLATTTKLLMASSVC